MPGAGFIAQLGMFVVPGFFDAALCASLRHEMRSSPSIPAGIRDHENKIRVDQDQRRTEKALASPETQAHVMSCLMATRSSLEKHFGIELDHCQPLSFLIYREGYSFGRHTDTAREPEAPLMFRERRVSVSVFLNGEGGESDPDTYSGGSLTFYGSPTQQRHIKFPEISLTGEEGLLIGFRSDWPHAVQRIHRGARYSIVTWFV